MSARSAARRAGMLRPAALGVLLAGLVATGCSGGSGSAAPSSPPTAAPTPTATLTPNDGRILSSVADGQVVHGVTTWQVSPRFPQATQGEPVVQFLIDDVLSWRERHEPYRFHGDDQRFDTRRLTNGPHVLKVTATYASGQRAEFTARITVRNEGAIVPGPYTDYAYTALVPNVPRQQVGGVALGGRWLLTLPGKNRLKLSPQFAEPLEVPLASRTDGSFVLTPAGCPGLRLAPQVDTGAVRFRVQGTPPAGCRSYALLLTERSWSTMPG